MKCSCCGVELPEDSVFCQYCGKHIETQSHTESSSFLVKEESSDVQEKSEVLQENPSVLIKCDNCGAELPDDSLFCQYCGFAFKRNAPKEEKSFSGEENRSLHQDEKTDVADDVGKTNEEFFPSNASELCDAEEEIPSKGIIIKESVPLEAETISDLKPMQKKLHKDISRSKVTVFIAVISILLLASCGLNIVQYLRGERLLDSVATKIAELEEVNELVEYQEKTLSDQRKEIASLKYSMISLEEKAEYFDALSQALKSGRVGYASDNFRASEGVILVSRNSTNRRFNLYTTWSGYGTVSVEYSGYAAYVEFTQDSWQSSTALTISPNYEGVSVVTFSNDYDNTSFNVVIIVTD